jgi:hypothetical protein
MKKPISSDDAKPHFSLKEMKHISCKGAKQLINEMFHEISRTHYNYRESWEILIEVLGHHLGIVEQPWLYSDPSRDIEMKVDRLNPMKKPAFWVERQKLDGMAMLASLLGIPIRQPSIRISEPVGPYHLPREIYYEHRYKATLKQYSPFTRNSTKESKKFLQQFERKDFLPQYVEKTRTEDRNPTVEGGYNGVDHLGAIFEEYELAGKANMLGQCLTPMDVVDFICMSTIGDKAITDQPLTVLDTQCNPHWARTMRRHGSISYRSKPPKR